MSAATHLIFSPSRRRSREVANPQKGSVIFLQVPERLLEITVFDPFGLSYDSVSTNPRETAPQRILATSPNCRPCGSFGCRLGT